MNAVFSWELLSDGAETINLQQYEQGFNKLTKDEYLTIDKFDPRAHFFFNNLATQYIEVERDQKKVKEKVMYRADYVNGWHYILGRMKDEYLGDADFQTIPKDKFEKYVYYALHYDKIGNVRFAVLQMEVCMQHDFLYTWENFEKQLEILNKKEGRTKVANYQCRNRFELDPNSKINWHHLFKDRELEKFEALLKRIFKKNNRFPHLEKMYLESFVDQNLDARKELGDIIYEAARRNGVDSHEDLDSNSKKFKIFSQNINGYMQKLCPRTHLALQPISYYYLLIPKDELSRLVLTYEYQPLPAFFDPNKHLKEDMLRVWNSAMNSNKHDDWITRDLKDKIKEEILQDTDIQRLNLDIVLSSTGNPYIVCFNTHP